MWLLAEFSLFLRPAHNSLPTKRKYLVVLPLLFLEAQAFCNATQNVFQSNQWQEEMKPYLPGPTLSRSFVCFYFMHYLSRKVFCNTLIHKFQNYSPRTVFSTVYVLVLEQILVEKNCVFLFLRPVTNTHFPDHLQTPTF